jgi:predicted glutamine amidotransferase
MCRLLAYASTIDRPVHGLLSDEEFSAFSDLSDVHNDGWGMAWLPDTGVEREIGSTRNATTAIDDPTYQAFAATPMGRAGFIHLRLATEGFPVTKENAHPFRAGGWLFGHNGSIPQASRLEDLLDVTSKELMVYDTDSKIYFLLALQRIRELGDPVKGMQRAIADIRSLCGTCSLNAVLMSRDVLIAVESHPGAVLPLNTLKGKVNEGADLPLDHDRDNYYTLRWSKRGDSFVVASTGMNGGEWHQLGDDTMVVVDLDENTVSIHPIDSSAPSDVFSLAEDRSH